MQSVLFGVVLVGVTVLGLQGRGRDGGCTVLERRPPSCFVEQVGVGSDVVVYVGVWPWTNLNALATCTCGEICEKRGVVGVQCCNLEHGYLARVVQKVAVEDPQRSNHGGDGVGAAG